MTSVVRRQLLGLLSAAALLLLTGGGIYGLFFYTPPKPPPPPPPPVPEDKSADDEPQELSTGVYALTELSPSTAYVIKTTAGLAIVDTGIESDCSKLLPLVKKLGLDIGELKHIFLTHSHGDHVNGAEHLRELTGAKVYAGQGDCEVLRSGSDWDAFFSKFEIDPGVDVHPTTVDVELVGGESIVLGDVRFDVLATPGHTPGSTCYLMRRGEGPRVLFTGDTIMSFDSLGTYAAYLSPRYRGDAAQYLQTLRELSEMHRPDMVMPGHPFMSAGEVNMGRASVTEKQWQELLGEGITAMMDLLERYEVDGRDYLDGRPREILPGVTYLGDLEGLALYCLVQGDQLTLIDAPGGPALVEALDARMAEQGLALAHVRQVLLTSCDPQATSGLAAVVERTGCRVVAGQAGLESLAAICPPGTTIVAAEALAEEPGQVIRALPLGGMGAAPMAYYFEFAGKSVLASGRLPIDPNDESEHAYFEPGNTSEEDLGAYIESMRKLGPLSPDLWLSARPIAERNANVYEGDWEFLVEANTRVAEAVLAELQGRAPPPPRAE